MGSFVFQSVSEIEKRASRIIPIQGQSDNGVHGQRGHKGGLSILRFEIGSLTAFTKDNDYCFNIEKLPLTIFREYRQQCCIISRLCGVPSIVPSRDEVEDRLNRKWSGIESMIVLMVSAHR